MVIPLIQKIVPALILLLDGTEQELVGAHVHHDARPIAHTGALGIRPRWLSHGTFINGASS